MDDQRLTADAAATLSRYVQFDTSNPPGNEMPAALWLRDQLKDRGITSHIDLYEPAAGRGLVVARIDGQESLKPLMLNHHIDVVSADASQWTHPLSAAGSQTVLSGVAAPWIPRDWGSCFSSPWSRFSRRVSAFVDPLFSRPYRTRNPGVRMACAGLWKTAGRIWTPNGSGTKAAPGYGMSSDRGSCFPWQWRKNRFAAFGLWPQERRDTVPYPTPTMPTPSS